MGLYSIFKWFVHTIKTVLCTPIQPVLYILFKQLVLYTTIHIVFG